jgi:hypothetical protein
MDTMTNKVCSTFCADFDYFGTEFIDQCYCGNDPRLEPANVWDCNEHCKGNKDTPETCGGFFFLSVWKKNNDTTA